MTILGSKKGAKPALGGSWGVLGRSWAALGRSWVALSRSFAALGPLLADFHETLLKPTKKGGLAGAHTHAYAFRAPYVIFTKAFKTNEKQ